MSATTAVASFFFGCTAITQSSSATRAIAAPSNASRTDRAGARATCHAGRQTIGGSSFHARGLGRFDEQFHVVPASGGRDPQPVARAAALKGASWLPDSSGIVSSSSAGSTLIYPPTFNLRRVGRDGTGDHAITFGDISYTEPNVNKSGTILTTCTRAQSNIWRSPVSGSPTENTRAAVRVTRQSGQVQTPSVSPNGKEVVYLSDSGGHANLWITRTDGTGIPRQITFERDPMTTIGFRYGPRARTGSPSSSAVIVLRSGPSTLTDGELSETVARGIAPCWSPDGRGSITRRWTTTRNGASKRSLPRAARRWSSAPDPDCPRACRWSRRALLRHALAADGRTLGLGVSARKPGGRCVSCADACRGFADACVEALCEHRVVSRWTPARVTHRQRRHVQYLCAFR